MSLRVAAGNGYIQIIEKSFITILKLTDLHSGCGYEKGFAAHSDGPIQWRGLEYSLEFFIGPGNPCDPHLSIKLDQFRMKGTILVTPGLNTWIVTTNRLILAG